MLLAIGIFILSAVLQAAQMIFAAETSTNTTLVLVAFISSVPTSIAAIASVLAARKTRLIHNEVRTTNGLTVGQLADNVESRRIEMIPVPERTVAEEQHIAGVPVPTDAVPQESNQSAAHIAALPDDETPPKKGT